MGRNINLANKQTNILVLFLFVLFSIAVLPFSSKEERSFVNKIVHGVFVSQSTNTERKKESLRN